MGVSRYNGTPKSSILIEFFIIFTYPFLGFFPLYLETHHMATKNHAASRTFFFWSAISMKGSTLRMLSSRFLFYKSAGCAWLKLIDSHSWRAKWKTCACIPVATLRPVVLVSTEYIRHIINSTIGWSVIYQHPQGSLEKDLTPKLYLFHDGCMLLHIDQRSKGPMNWSCWPNLICNTTWATFKTLMTFHEILIGSYGSS